MSRPNWFFGLPIDGSFILELDELPSSFRRFHPEDVHLTLAFLGPCSESQAENALAALDERLEADPRPVIDVSLGKVVPMGSRRRYTALSALIGEGRERAAECIVSLRDVLTEAAQGRLDDRPPKPHVTLARPRRQATRTEREAGLAWAARLDLSSVNARLDRIALYTWSETRKERLFRIVAERPLGSSRK